MGKRQASATTSVAKSDAATASNNKKARGGVTEDANSVIVMLRSLSDEDFDVVCQKISEMRHTRDGSKAASSTVSSNANHDGTSSTPETESGATNTQGEPALDLSVPWNGRYVALKDHYEIFGRDLPSTHLLASWSRLQRKEWKKLKQAGESNLTRERINLLNEIKFDWETGENEKAGNKWEIRFDELVEFFDDHGHCNVPKKYAANPPLAKWVSNQRYGYTLLKQGKASCLGMTQDRVDRLNAIDKAWAGGKGKGKM